MQRRGFVTVLLLLRAAAVRADDSVERPFLVQQTGGHTAPIWKVLFTQDGKEIITVSEDKTVRRWNAVTGERLGVLRPPMGLGVHGELRAGALSPDGKTLAVGGVGYGAGETRFVPILFGSIIAVVAAKTQGDHRKGPGGEIVDWEGVPEDKQRAAANATPEEPPDGFLDALSLQFFEVSQQLLLISPADEVKTDHLVGAFGRLLARP